MPSADQVPVRFTHSTMLWPMWVVLIAGSTGSALRAVRIADHGKRARREQAAQIAVALFADAAELVFAPARVLLWNKPNPRREVPPRSECFGIGNARDQSRGQRRTDPGDRIEPLARFI